MLNNQAVTTPYTDRSVLEFADSILQSLREGDLQNLRTLRGTDAHSAIATIQSPLFHKPLEVVIKDCGGFFHSEFPLGDALAYDSAKKLGYFDLVMPACIIPGHKISPLGTKFLPYSESDISVRFLIQGETYRDLGLNAGSISASGFLFDFLIGDGDRCLSTSCRGPNTDNIMRRTPDGAEVFIDFGFAFHPKFNTELIEKNIITADALVKQQMQRGTRYRSQVVDFAQRLSKVTNEDWSLLFQRYSLDGQQPADFFLRLEQLRNVFQAPEFQTTSTPINLASVRLPPSTELIDVIGGNRSLITPINPPFYSLEDPNKEALLRDAEKTRMLLFNEILMQNKRAGLVSGLALDLRPHTQRETILVGDLHGKVEVFEKIVKKIIHKLVDENARLVFLGDLLHSERPTQLYDMKPSLELFRRFLRLKIMFPDQVFSVLGNHEPLNVGATKGGIEIKVNQSQEFKTKLRYYYGDEFLKLYARYMELAPLIITGEDYIGMHAGPVRENSVGSFGGNTSTPISLHSFTRAAQFQDVAPDKIPPFVRDAIGICCNHEDEDQQSRFRDQAYVGEFLGRFGYIPEKGALISGHRIPRDHAMWYEQVNVNMLIINAEAPDGNSCGYLSIVDGVRTPVTINGESRKVRSPRRRTLQSLVEPRFEK